MTHLEGQGIPDPFYRVGGQAFDMFDGEVKVLHAGWILIKMSLVPKPTLSG